MIENLTELDGEVRRKKSIQTNWKLQTLENTKRANNS